MFSILRTMTRESPALKDAGLLLLRLWFGIVLALGHGLGKVGNLEKFLSSVSNMGFPLPALTGTFAALSEFVGGLMLALGLFARPAAAAVAITMLSAAFVVHADDPFMKKEFALAYGAVAACILISGAGRFSLDRWLSKRRH